MAGEYTERQIRDMHLKIEIDEGSGFCYGVVRAIGKAEEILSASGKLYSLGAIVHNDTELERLAQKGLTSISYDEFENGAPGHGAGILIRAHGEPPKTYAIAEKNSYRLIDCTCPVVLRLQEKIRAAAKRIGGNGRILIFGKKGHAEVNGLVGQAEAEGCDVYVIENEEMLHSLSASGKIGGTGTADSQTEIFSQTTKDQDGYRRLCDSLKRLIPGIKINDTICGQVASRHARLTDFAARHDTILFVSGKESSNGKVLYGLCKKANPRSHFIEDENGIKPEWFHEGESVGICGATSTPKWLLERVATSLTSGVGLTNSPDKRPDSLQ